MLVLATDIDGTFLGGSLSDRNQLYQLIRSLGGEMLLIFVTGRALENIEPLLADPSIPNPDYIIADVGASVVHGETREPVEPLDRDLAARWVGEEPILAAIPPSLALERQQQAQQRRCSFYTDDPEVVEAVRRAVAPLGCAVLYSAERYLDVLPVGIDKGHTLSRLIDHLGLDPEDVLVAGDSLNDLSVFTHTRFRGVVVGGGEPALREGTRHLAHVYQARAPGAAGILEAIESLGWLEAAEPRREPPGEAELVVVYHRQPFDEVVEEGVVRRRPPASPNGVIPTLLGLFGDGRRGAWVAWSTCEAEPAAPFEARVRLEGGELPNLTISRLPLTAEDVDLFYKRLSKDALWPILHSFIERATFDHRQWQHFHHVNRLFAQRAAAESARGALVWIHDYNLWLVPEYLRRLRPDLRIAFFHHTPFPAADIFHVIPWSREIVSSLLKCDYLGFHIPRYCENFVDAARSHFPLKVEERCASGGRFLASGTALSVERTTARIGAREPSTALGAHPVGLDVRRIETILATPELEAARRRLEEDLGGKKIVFCAQRLDYMKGPLQKLLAFERFLALYPVWREKITLIDICVPPAEGMGVYDSIRGQVEQAVGRINGRFSTAGWSPVKFLFRRVPFEEVVAYLAVADVAWITPLRDGLNLVAKEYVAVRTGLEKAGVLVISEFAGSSVELDGALLTNPYDIAEMADTLERALGMDEAEQRRRMLRLGEVVREFDVERWARDFVASARSQAEGLPARPREPR
jgi:glucosylglycerol-phosphate synthase